VTAHFGDLFWIRHTLGQLDEHSDARIERVVVVDQSRRSAAELAVLPRVSDVLEFPPDEDQVRALGHDHPAALDRALAAAAITSSHVLVLDSDCFPLHASWLDRLDDITLATDPARPGLTHPCLLAFPAPSLPEVSLTAGIGEHGLDTGRLVGQQLAAAGRAVSYAEPEPAYRGLRGHYYLGRTVYHHGAASFGSSSDPRLTRQVSARQDAIFRRLVAQGRREVPPLDLVRLAAGKVVSRTRWELVGRRALSRERPRPPRP
jgi:hypothetical protein